MLRQSLVLARAVGVDRVLVTCDDANAASAVVIERLGGLLDDVRLGDEALQSAATGLRERPVTAHGS